MKKVAIVTAASSGLGAAIASKLARQEHQLVIMSSSERIIPVAEQLDAKYYIGSLDNAEDLENLVQFAQSEYGRVDVLVNNTGHPAKGELLKLTDDQWQEGMNIILMNVIRLARLVTPIMQNLGGGSIINISTFTALEPALKFPISSTMRAALASYTKLYTDKYGESNIRMNNILPGYIDNHPVAEEIIKDMPLRRAGKVEEIANAVAFLASNESAYITGQNLKVDGGLARSV